jgi:hypothetical protein
MVVHGAVELSLKKEIHAAMLAAWPPPMHMVPSP